MGSRTARFGTLLRLALVLVLSNFCWECHSFHPPAKRSVSSVSWRERVSVTESRKVRAAPLEASPLLAAGSPLGSLLVLAGIVLVHESGHYAAARAFGITVEEFSIGFGPKLFGFEALGNEFNLRAFPLGGYVRFPENYNTTLASQQEKEYQKLSESTDDLPGVTPGFRVLNALTLGALAEQRRKQLQNEQLQAQKAQESSLPWWKKAFATSPQQQQPTIPTEPPEIEYYDDPKLLQNRPWPERAVVLSAGVVCNLLLAFFIYFGEIGFGGGLPQPRFEPGAVVTSVPRQDGAASGILRKGDVIVSVNGSPLTMAQNPSPFAAQQAITDFISTIRSTPEGDSLSLSVLRADKVDPMDVMVKPKPMGSSGPQSIGVMLSPNFIEIQKVKTDSVTEAVKLAAGSVSELTLETTRGLLSFVTQAFNGKAAASGQVSGPIGLIRTGSEVVSSQDLTAILLFAAAISVNLGVVNALPLPALDGGQLVFVLAEALTGRKVNQRLQESVTGVAVLLLLLISVSTAFGDVQSIFLR